MSPGLRAYSNCDVCCLSRCRISYLFTTWPTSSFYIWLVSWLKVIISPFSNCLYSVSTSVHFAVSQETSSLSTSYHQAVSSVLWAHSNLCTSFQNVAIRNEKSAQDATQPEENLMGIVFAILQFLWLLPISVSNFCFIFPLPEEKYGVKWPSKLRNPCWTEQTGIILS